MRIIKNNQLYLHRETNNKANDNINTYSFSRQVIKNLANIQKSSLTNAEKDH